MEIVFITLVTINSINDHNIYSDLLREFLKQGDSVTVFCPSKEAKSTIIEASDRHKIYHINLGKIVKTNPIKKGINTLLYDSKIKKAAKKNSNDKVDLLVYSTPPITLIKTIRYFKRKYNCKTYLLLKDIFPQNAVDLGLLSTKGIKGIVLKYFKGIEQKLYDASDFIGCMSQANVEYIKIHNQSLRDKCIEVNPNSIDIERCKNFVPESKEVVRKRYSLPTNKKIFVYGGNLGKPQSIDFIIECLEASRYLNNVHFVIIGDGTEYKLLDGYYQNNKNSNFTLLNSLENDEYLQLISSCDVGLIFLSFRFTIPNFPSRLLDYMLVGLPIFACTDNSSDIGKIITEAGFGWWEKSNSSKAFAKKIYNISSNNIKDVKKLEFDYLDAHFNVSDSCDMIKSHF